MSTLLGRRREEFARFVWDHGVDAFQAKFDARARLTDREIAFLLDLLSVPHLHSLGTLVDALDGALFAEPDRLRLLLQLVGLTRNKIVQDLKAFSRSTGTRFSVSSARSIFNHRDGRRHGVEYLARQLLRVFGAARGDLNAACLEVANQATWPGYIRQERAKRMGHEAESRVAALLKDCGLAFEPVGKAENPMCPDATIGGVSYDLVSPSVDNALLRVKSTVHSSNIGQYGQSKDHLEMREAKRAIAGEGVAGVTLLAFIDGVGFESNRAGLSGVLTTADEFCQFRTIWKAAVVASAKAGRRVTVALPGSGRVVRGVCPAVRGRPRPGGGRDRGRPGLDGGRRRVRQEALNNVPSPFAARAKWLLRVPLLPGVIVEPCSTSRLRQSGTAHGSSIRRRISGRKSGLISAPIPRRPITRQTFRVVPEPTNGSSTRSPGSV